MSILSTITFGGSTKVLLGNLSGLGWAAVILSSTHRTASDLLAVRVGFEPTEPAKVQRFSRPPDSTALAPHRIGTSPIFPQTCIHCHYARFRVFGSRATAVSGVPRLGDRHDRNFLCDSVRTPWHTVTMSLANLVRITRARISIRVFLRLTAMDVCCGPPNTPLS
jgi:hypothetical protein